MNTKRITVGTNLYGYNQLRNFISLPFQNVNFQKVYDFNKLVTHLKYKVLSKVDHHRLNQFNNFGLSNVHLYHFFNALTPSRKPWIVTYESQLPRPDTNFINGYDWLSGNSCKKIIALSQRAHDAQSHLLDQHPSYRESIKEKMMILQPSQERLLDGISSKDFDGEIVFTFIGRHFFRKGGWELFQAFERLCRLGLPIKLIVISDMEFSGYQDWHITPEMVSQAKRLLSTNPLIEHYTTMPNFQVLEILKRSHIGILPSWGETYGYSVLEAMACGCAVVVPNVSPFPEFVSPEWGWLLEVNKTLTNGAERSDPTVENSQRMIDGIVATVQEIVSNRDTLQSKCENALNAISMNHNPLKAATVLEDIYQKAI